MVGGANMELDALAELLKAIEIVHGKAVANRWRIIIYRLTKEWK
jgi:hypothetical protein